jgi:hypothetical protein
MRVVEHKTTHFTQVKETKKNMTTEISIPF